MFSATSHPVYPVEPRALQIDATDCAYHAIEQGLGLCQPGTPNLAVQLVDEIEVGNVFPDY